MAGIIDSALPGNNTADNTSFDLSKPQAVSDASGLAPVNQQTDTVAGQMDKLLAKDSPYMQQARSGALDTANARGLLNSSMAAGAGESAAIGAALPIAQQDASTNANATGQERQGVIQSQLQSQGATEAQGLAQTQGEQQRQTLAQSGTQDVALQTLKGSQATDLANIEANYKNLLQANASASGFYTSITAAMSQIMSNTDTTQEQKQAGLDSMSQLLKSGLSIIGGISNLDLTGLLDFTATA